MSKYRMTRRNPSWSWVAPLRQPIVGRSKMVLACLTPGPLTLPDVCCHCGQPTEKSRPVRVVESNKGEGIMQGAQMLAGHVGSIVAGVRVLTQPKIMVPSCSACWSIHRRGIIAGLTIILVAFGLLVGFASMSQDTKLRMPVWLTFAAVVGPLMSPGYSGAPPGTEIRSCFV